MLSIADLRLIQRLSGDIRGLAQSLGVDQRPQLGSVPTKKAAVEEFDAQVIGSGPGFPVPYLWYELTPNAQDQLIPLYGGRSGIATERNNALITQFPFNALMRRTNSAGNQPNYEFSKPLSSQPSGGNLLLSNYQQSPLVSGFVDTGASAQFAAGQYLVIFNCDWNFRCAYTAGNQPPNFQLGFYEAPFGGSPIVFWNPGQANFTGGFVSTIGHTTFSYFFVFSQATTLGICAAAVAQSVTFPVTGSNLLLTGMQFTSLAIPTS